MRLQIIIAIFLFPIFSSATPKTAAELMQDSQSARAEVSKKKSFSKTAKKLKDFENSLNMTIKEYEKESPLEGGEEEEKVVKFSYRFEGPFNLAGLKSANKKVCEKIRSQIEFEDKTGQTEDAKLSEAAEESLKWLELLCK
jgi:hypothetical protein